MWMDHEFMAAESEGLLRDLWKNVRILVLTIPGCGVCPTYSTLHGKNGKVRSTQISQTGGDMEWYGLVSGKGILVVSFVCFVTQNDWVFYVSMFFPRFFWRFFWLLNLESIRWCCHEDIAQVVTATGVPVLVLLLQRIGRRSMYRSMGSFQKRTFSGEHGAFWPFWLKPEQASRRKNGARTHG